MQSSTEVSQSADGVDRFIYCWLPDGEVRAAAHIAHGMAEHGARYARVAEALTAAGVAVYANDHRGHGKTHPDEGRGYFADEDGWGKCVADLGDLVARAKEKHPDVPFILIGHSMGSMLVQDYLGSSSDQVDAVVLSGTSGKPPAIATVGRYIARLERWRLGPHGRSGIIDAMSFQDFNKNFKPNRTGFDWLSRDQAEVDTYVADPDSGFICSVQLWIDLLDNVPRFTSDDHQQGLRKDLPMYIFAGDKDPVGEMGKSVESLAADYRKAGLTEVTCTLYPDARHETLNETNRDEVTADLIAWIESRIAT